MVRHIYESMTSSCILAAAHAHQHNLAKLLHSKYLGYHVLRCPRPVTCNLSLKTFDINGSVTELAT